MYIDEDNRYDDAKLIKDNIKLFANSISYSRASFAFFNENVSLLDSSLYNADLQDTNFNYGLYKISVVTSCSQIDVEDNKVALESDAQTKLSIKTLRHNIPNYYRSQHSYYISY